MPAFYNQATLYYNDQSTRSNIVQGQLMAVLTAAKTAVNTAYRPGETVTYAVSLVNSGAAAYNGLTVTDDLGAYPFGGGMVTPLDYVPGSLRLFVDGVLQPAPAVTGTDPLTITGISVPAGGNALLVYAAAANAFAPLSQGGVITNVAVVDGAQLAAPVTASAALPADSTADLGIIKAIDPVNVVENEPFTYTFTIQNRGTQPAVATDNVTVTDLFDPVLTIQSVALNGVPLAEGTGYTYNDVTGDFATVPGVITVPAATVQQDPATGVWTVNPGITVLTVTGVI